MENTREQLISYYYARLSLQNKDKSTKIEKQEYIKQQVEQILKQLNT